MSDFQIYFTLGLKHVLSLGGYDHLLFLAMLALPYSFKEWRQVLLLATLFTIGHTMSLVLGVYNVVTVPTGPVEFLISLTIFVTALFNIFKPKAASGSINAIALLTLFFGIVHGLGFSHGFKMLVAGNPDNTFFPLVEFTLGIETAQLIAVLGVVLISLVAVTILKVNRRDWLLVVSAFVAGISLPLILQNRFW